MCRDFSEKEIQFVSNIRAKCIHRSYFTIKYFYRSTRWIRGSVYISYICGEQIPDARLTGRNKFYALKPDICGTSFFRFFTKVSRISEQLYVLLFKGSNNLSFDFCKIS